LALVQVSKGKVKIGRDKTGGSVSARTHITEEIVASGVHIVLVDADRFLSPFIAWFHEDSASLRGFPRAFLVVH
jgi:hypothetical protein